MNARLARCVVVTLVSAFAVGFEIVALGQSDVEADPSHHKLLFENAKVRVVKVKFEPGAKSTSPFDAREVVLVRLKGTGPLTLHLPDGKVITGKSMAPGDAGWAPAGRIQPQNKTNESIELIVIEPK